MGGVVFTPFGNTIFASKVTVSTFCSSAVHIISDTNVPFDLQGIIH